MFFSGMLNLDFHCRAFSGVPVIMPDRLQYFDSIRPVARILAYRPKPQSATFNFFSPSTFIFFSERISKEVSVGKIAVELIPKPKFLTKDRLEVFFMFAYLIMVMCNSGWCTQILS